jgi:hypothetical protein
MSFNTSQFYHFEKVKNDKKFFREYPVRNKNLLVQDNADTKYMKDLENRYKNDIYQQYYNVIPDITSVPSELNKKEEKNNLNNILIKYLSRNTSHKKIEKNISRISRFIS